MDEILSKYQKLLTKYNISSTSSYRTKYNNLSSMFSSLKNSSNELLARTKSLIKMVNANDYDTYYTKYMEQISDLTSKIEAYCKTIMDEYDTLLNSISDDYDILY
jgi:Zn-dependent M32 family carboxypeptidase